MNWISKSRGPLLAAALLFAGAAHAADEIVSMPLRFAKGASSVTVKGTIQGRQTIDYKLRAKGGQTMTVDLRSRHPGLAFNVLPPGSQDVAIPQAIARQQWSGTLPTDGEYTVRTYLDRADARRGAKARYRLKVAVGGVAAAAAVSAADARPSAARRSGAGSFDETGQVSCAQSPAQPMGQCEFGVLRAGGGTATVVITRPDGRTRSVFFEKGKAIGADLSLTDRDMTFHGVQDADLYKIQAGTERYEIPEAVVFGG